MEASELYKSYETDFLLAQSEIEQKLESIATLERGEFCGGRTMDCGESYWRDVDREGLVTLAMLQLMVDICVLVRAG